MPSSRPRSTTCCRRSSAGQTKRSASFFAQRKARSPPGFFVARNPVSATAPSSVIYCRYRRPWLSKNFTLAQDAEPSVCFNALIPCNNDRLAWPLLRFTRAPPFRHGLHPFVMAATSVSCRMLLGPLPGVWRGTLRGAGDWDSLSRGKYKCEKEESRCARRRRAAPKVHPLTIAACGLASAGVRRSRPVQVAYRVRQQPPQEPLFRPFEAHASPPARKQRA